MGDSLGGNSTKEAFSRLLAPFFPSTNSLLYAGCRMAFTLGGEESLTPFWVNMERFTRDSAKPPRKIR